MVSWSEMNRVSKVVSIDASMMVVIAVLGPPGSEGLAD